MPTGRWRIMLDTIRLDKKVQYFHIYMATMHVGFPKEYTNH